MIEYEWSRGLLETFNLYKCNTGKYIGKTYIKLDINGKAELPRPWQYMGLQENRRRIYKYNNNYNIVSSYLVPLKYFSGLPKD